MRISSFIGWLIIAMTLAGCTLAIHEARKDLYESKAAYKKCTGDNPQDLTKCEPAKQRYEADLKTFEAETRLFQKNRVQVE